MSRPTSSSLVIIALGALLFGAACEKKSTTVTNTVNRTTNQQPTVNTNTTANRNVNVAATVTWMQTNEGWQASGTVPPCPTPVLSVSPVSLDRATSILYPGQTRGGNYKPHGGFRFDRSTNTDITVVAPMDGQVANASRYLEGGETQYLFTFIHPCGMMYRFDHLLTLSPAMQAIAETLPPASDGDSRTTNIMSGVTVKAGDVIATAVGFKNTKNVSVDFGVYDLRAKNASSADPAYVAAHPSDLDQRGVCWFSLLPSADAAKVTSLPAADQNSGKMSDYCR